jgi:hypothetical protein
MRRDSPMHRDDGRAHKNFNCRVDIKYKYSVILDEVVLSGTTTAAGLVESPRLDHIFPSSAHKKRNIYGACIYAERLDFSCDKRNGVIPRSKSH